LVSRVQLCTVVVLRSQLTGTELPLSVASCATPRYSGLAASSTAPSCKIRTEAIIKNVPNALSPRALLIPSPSVSESQRRYPDDGQQPIRRHLMPSKQPVLESLARASSWFVRLLPARSSPRTIPNISTFPRRSLFPADEADKMAFDSSPSPSSAEDCRKHPLLPFSSLMSGVVVQVLVVGQPQCRWSIRKRLASELEMGCILVHAIRQKHIQRP
jgi:hypothetical protein